MNIAIERKQLLEYMWTDMKKQNPTHDINKKDYKTIFSYWKAWNFVDHKVKMGKMRSIKKILEESLIPFALHLKNREDAEVILIFRIKNKNRDTNSTLDYDSIKDIHLWSKDLDKLIKNTFDKIFIGAETIKFCDFKNAPTRNEYFSENNFKHINLTQYN